MPTIAIDYTPAIRQSAGIGRIIRGQIGALVRLADYDMRLFAAGPVTPKDKAIAPAPLFCTQLSERNLVRIWHRLNLPCPRVEWFTGGPLDLFHATDFVMAPNSARRKLLTVHDLAFIFYPDAAMPSLHHYLNTVVPRSIRRADHLIADSHHTARDLNQQWQIPSECITVVQGAVDHSRFHPAESDKDKLDCQAIRERYGLGEEPIILAVSRLEPRKNFSRLIQAFHRANLDHKLPHKLVIAGSKGWLYDSIFATVEELNLVDRVLFPGFVDDVDLPALYRCAEVFAYPSLYEGFGLPILEALASGTPVLTANNSCLPEAGGDGALYVDAEDVDSIADGLVQICTDVTLQTQLRAAGTQHAASFSWESSACQLLNAYATVLD